jgi:DNA-binding NtrC family response regulator
MAQKPVLWIGSHLPATGAAGAWHIDARSPGTGLEELRPGCHAAAVLDFPVPGWTAARLLEAVRRAAPGVPVIVRDPAAGLAEAVRLARMGAWPCAPDDDVFKLLEEALREQAGGDLARLAAGAARLAGAPAGNSPTPREDWEDLLVGESPEMRRVGHLIRMVGGRRATVLITGETGTGKEVAARALHLAGGRRRAPFVAVNCSALPENLLEAELFGHVKGAFTGAHQARVGRFEQAQNGTLLLDEIGDMPLELQAKLLRVLQEREFQRLGSSENVQLEARVVAATNSDPERLLEQGRFREDLYYRLNVVPIHMPPLRQRPGDVPLLARHFVDKICRLEDLLPKSLDEAAEERLRGYSWPGNVRQLENAVEMAAALSGERRCLGPGDFPLASGVPRPQAAAPFWPGVAVPDEGLDYERTLARIERAILEQALRKTGGNKKAAADMLRLKRTTLSAKMRSLEAYGSP